MTVPLAVLVQGAVTGLDVAYEVSNESFAKLLRSKSPTDADEFEAYVYNQARKRPSSIIKSFDKSLMEVDIRDMKVNRSFHISFLIRNLSGISTDYIIGCKNYLVEKFRGRKLTVVESLTNSRITDLKKKIPPINHSLLTDKHENLNFTSDKGVDFNKMKQFEKDSNHYLSNRKGLAIVIDPLRGKLDPFSELTINVDIYNEMIGDFTDEIYIDIKSLPLKVVPIKLKIRGNPLQIYPFQPGIDYNSVPPIVKVGHILTKVGYIDKMFKLYNIGSNLLSLVWKIFDYNEILHPSKDIFKIQIQEDKGIKNSTFSINYQTTEPEELTDDRFTINPTSATLQPKSTSDFRIRFMSEFEGLQSVLMVAYPKFEDSSINARLTELAIKVDAYCVKPFLEVDKLKNYEGQHVYKFESHSFGISPRPKRSVVLMNKEKINFVVSLHLEGPFKIGKIEPMEACIGNNLYNIIPNSNLKVEIKFLQPNPSNEAEWSYQLLCQKSGRMTVLFENNEYLDYNLLALLKRPKIILSTTGNESIQSLNLIEFGLVNCESFRKTTIYISNVSEVDTRWSINYVKHVPKKNYGHGTMTNEEKEDIQKTDDASVFNFSISEGLISGPSNQLINIPHNPLMPRIYNKNDNKYQPVKIEIMFKVN
jgi:hypothetical protein